jgi:signal transduction histidine kinase
MNKITRIEYLKEEVAKIEHEIADLKDVIENERNEIDEEAIFWKKTLDIIPISTYVAIPAKIIWCNSFMEKSFGYFESEWRAFNQVEFRSKFHPDDFSVLQKAVEEIVKGKTGTLCEIRMKGKDGVWRWYIMSASMFEFPDDSCINNSKKEIMDWIYCSLKMLDFPGEFGIPKSIVALLSIDHRKKMESQLQENEEKYKKLVSSLFDMLIVFQDEKVIFANKTALEVLDYSAQEIHELSLKDFLAEEIISNFRKDCNFQNRGEFISNGEIELKTKRNISKPVFMRSSKILSEGKILMMVLFTDLTELRERQSLQEYANRLIFAQEMERRRISRELHDNILQILMSSLSSIDYCKSRSAEELPEEALKARQLINTAVNEIRKISHNLHPIILEDLGLKPALHKLIREFKEKTGIEIETDFEKASDDLAYELNISIYRIFQDALTNIENYQSVNNIRLSCSVVNSIIEIRIIDNRKVFFVKKIKEGSRDTLNLSLRNIMERVRILNGEFDLKATAGKDTELAINIPF